MKLLLDGHLHRGIAHRLRNRAHDVVTVPEESLREIDDHSLMEAAAARGRALVTGNVGDLAAIARRWAAEGRDHSGLVYTNDAGVPRSAAGTGEMIRRLEHALETHPAPDALANRAVWLVTPPG